MRFELHPDHFILDGSGAVLFDTMEIINKVPHYDNPKSEVRNFTLYGEMGWRLKLRVSIAMLRRIWRM